MMRDINKDIYNSIIYKTRIKKYDLNIPIFLLLPSYDFALPNVVIKYNNLYLFADFSQHMFLDYYLQVTHVYIPDEYIYGKAAIIPFNPTLISSELKEAYEVYYNTYVSKEGTKDYPNALPQTYELLLNGFTFSKDWFQIYPYMHDYSAIQEQSYIVEFKTVYQNSRPTSANVIIDIFLALKDLDCSKSLSHYVTSNVASWEISESVFSQLPSRFTVHDVIPFVRDEITKGFNTREQFWRDLANNRLNNKPIVISIGLFDVLEPKITRIYVETSNKYGIYQGGLIVPTYTYDKIQSLLFKQHDLEEKI